MASLAWRRAGLLLLTIVLGCGSGRGGTGSGWLPPPTGGSIPVDALSAAYNTALCELGVRCQAVDSQRGCELGTQINRAPPKLVAAVAAGTVIYDPVQAARCVQLIREAPCLQGSYVINHPIVQIACHNAFKGTVPAGGACTQNVECVSESCHTPACPADVCCVGVCADNVPPARNLPIGATCTTIDECVEGAFCSAQDGCQPMVPVGASCEQAFCQWDSECLPSSATGMRTCAGYVAIGASCDGSLCGAPGTPIAYCALDLVCTASQYSDIGGPCDLNRSCLHGSCRDDGICHAMGILNEACAGIGSIPCEQGLWLTQVIECVNGVCTRPPPVRDPCDPP